MPDVVNAEVAKNGETCMYISLRRTPAGLTVSAKVHPRVEEFMKHIGDQGIVNVETVSRTWLPHEQGQSLRFYAGGPRLTIPPSEDGFSYSLDSVGRPLILDDGTLNLSFLRLVGISEGSGISFDIKGVHSLELLTRIRDRIKVAARRFYIDYLRPIDLSVTVSTLEIRQ